MVWRRHLWPEWTVEEEIGSGSYGTVYKIKRQDIGGTYYAALKVISVPRNEDEVHSLRSANMSETQIAEYYRGFAKKLAREFAVMERLKGNTNIVSYEDHKIIPRANGIGLDVLIRMELLTPLNRRISSSGCNEAMALRIGKDICNALMLCERENVLHRDIKPGNVFVSAHGNFKLGDFSIARVSDINITECSPLGTYAYMAPEIYAGKHYDHSIDIYSLGLILYRLLNSGRAPFLPMPPMALTPSMVEDANKRRLEGDPLPRPMYASPELAYVILKACAYRREDRYQTAKQLYDALVRCGNGAEHMPAGNDDTCMDDATFSMTTNQAFEEYKKDKRNGSVVEEASSMDRYFSSAGDL